ncbi:calmodulin-binding receptor-like cytoplasmic kinase 3 [Amborella trichopoda]|nr:calmodulin-binding receptor-like cytoplasmic kinase 3 [Amborella trichopoda]|eukprot:XP_006852871.2 calmodulin-binding receptor-like cytoplasmic kinase 3 [Amborella trichopoda]
MATLLLHLLVLLQFPGILIPVGAIKSRDCESGQFSNIGSLGCGSFQYDREFLEHGHLCEALEFAILHGCFCKYGLEQWSRIGKECCNMELEKLNDLVCIPYAMHQPRRAARKTLLQPRTKETMCHNIERISKFKGKDQHDSTSTHGNLVIAASGMLLLSCSMLCPCFRAKKKGVNRDVLVRGPNSMDMMSSFEVSASPHVPPSPSQMPPSPYRFSLSPQTSQNGPIHLSPKQIIKSTRNFSLEFKIGEGGFGTVYKAQLQDGQFVAVKRARKELFESLRTEFRSEVEMLAKIEHQNLVKLLGYIEQGHERLIIVEYVSNGTLREHLDGHHGRILDFMQRLEIAIGVAHGLTYLHVYAEQPIIHRDVKSSNILLTDQFRAKVADFGFARVGPTQADQTHIMTQVRGTAGYLDPEYSRTSQLTTKSDVFSFGILLIEILSGRRPIESRRAVDERVTLRWTFKMHSDGRMRDILDPLLEETPEDHILERIFDLAFQCAAPSRSERPTMREAVQQLWGIRRDYYSILRTGSRSQ